MFALHWLALGFSLLLIAVITKMALNPPSNDDPDTIQMIPIMYLLGFPLLWIVAGYGLRWSIHGLMGTW